MEIGYYCIFVTIFILLLFLVVQYQQSRELFCSERGLGSEPYATNIEIDTLANRYYRKVLYTSPNLQLVLMSLAPHEEIGKERHPNLTQFIRSEQGNGLAIINGRRYPLRDGEIVMIPPGAMHNVLNLSNTEPLQLYTIYSPPQHPPHTIHQSKADADREEKHQKSG